MVKCSIELRGATEPGDNSLWVVHYKRHVSCHTKLLDQFLYKQTFINALALHTAEEPQ